MTSPVDTTITKVLNQFRYKDPVLPLSGAINDSQTDPAVNDFLPNIGPGSIVQVDDEYMLVTAVTGTGPMTLTVVRGWLETVAASHSSGAPVYVNPRVLGDEVLDYINECLDFLYPELYYPDILTLAYDAGTIGYDLDASVGRVLRVDGEVDSTALYWKELKDWKFNPQADSTIFPSGKSLMIHGSLPHGAAIRVVYGVPFTNVVAGEDLETDGGLQAYMARLPYYYSMGKILATQEVGRSDSTGAASHQRAQDVPALSALRTGDWYNARYRELMDKAKARQAFEVKRGLFAAAYGD
jgi:hypothetical protein